MKKYITITIRKGTNKKYRLEKKCQDELYKMFSQGGKYHGVPMLLMSNLKVFKEKSKKDIGINLPFELIPAHYIIIENIFINKVNPKKTKYAQK